MTHINRRVKARARLGRIENDFTVVLNPTALSNWQLNFRRVHVLKTINPLNAITGAAFTHACDRRGRDEGAETSGLHRDRVVVGGVIARSLPVGPAGSAWTVPGASQNFLATSRGYR